MIIDRNLARYLINEDSSIQEVATKIVSWQGQIAFCVDESGRLIGSLSNGDLMRWMASGGSITGSSKAGDIANRQVKVGSLDNRPAIEQMLETFLYVPIVARDRRIVAVARKRQIKEGIKIDDRTIGLDSPTFIIAEIGNNHNGSIERAFNLIDASREAGADCAKFQMRDMKALYGGKSEKRSEDLGTEYLLDLLERFQLTDEELFRCFDYTKSLGMMPLCTAWEEASVDQCKSYGLPALKVASADLTNHDLLRYIADQELPMICSTGMSTEAEIIETASCLQAVGASYIMLHCNSTYPAPFRDINLRYLSRLEELSGGVVGYSGHERDTFVSCAAVSLGARVIEKHISLDRSLEGNDHKVSLLPNEFQRMVEGIRQVEESLGTDRARSLSQGERTNRVALSKSIFALQDIEPGSVIEASMVVTRSPGQGLQPNRMKELIGSVARRRIPANTPFYISDLDATDEVDSADKFVFDQPWGLPVRHRDAKLLIEQFKPDFVEFHLSYRDLDLNDALFFSESFDCGLVVHAPELFENDHTLDLTSPDSNYRDRSIREMKRVISKAKSLSRFFKNSGTVGIVTNVGGFSSDRFLTKSEQLDRENRLIESWEKLVEPGVQLWPQTMPPYPWHFGGQRFHNLFVSAENIVDLCQKLKTKVCLDVSHSRLACNEMGKSFDVFMEAVVPYAAYLHIADAKGVDGEGLQISEGEMDFEMMFRTLANAKSVSAFIPEIWQGHENNAEGFRIALQRLNRFARLARNSYS